MQRTPTRLPDTEIRVFWEYGAFFLFPRYRYIGTSIGDSGDSGDHLALGKYKLTLSRYFTVLPSGKTVIDSRVRLHLLMIVASKHSCLSFFPFFFAIFFSRVVTCVLIVIAGMFTRCAPFSSHRNSVGVCVTFSAV